MRLNRPILLRVAVDTVLINFSFLTALALRLLLIGWLRSPEVPTWEAYLEMHWKSLRAYQHSVWLVTLICLTVFYLSGFYTFGRGYRHRYKALIIFQAVSLSYLIIAFLAYFTRIMPLSRGVLLGSWFITLVMVGGARLGATIWTGMLTVERRMKVQGEIDGEIEKVLVIGGAGYIGSILVRKLLKKGYKVRLLDLLLYGDESIAELYNKPGFEFVKGDFRNVETIVHCFQDMDAVIHLGAIVGDPACALDEKLSIEINLEATRVIAKVAKGYGVQRFLFASTCSVYGASDEILDERSALNPVSLYARTKIDSEKVLLSFNDTNFSPTILRLATVYGLSYRPRFDLVVNLLAARAIRKRKVTIFGGQQWRPFIHVEDAAEAFVRCLQSPLAAVKGQIFNVGCNEQNYQIYRIGEFIKELVPEVIVTFEERDSDVRNYHVCFDKIRDQLGFVPGKTVEDGILEIKEAIEEGWIKDYKDQRYHNSKFLAEEDNARLVKAFAMSPLLTASPMQAALSDG